MSEHTTPAVIDDARPHYEDINTPVIFLLTAISAIVTYALIAAVQGLYFQWKNAELERVNARSVSAATTFLAQEKSLLETGSEERRIKPIRESMEKVVQQWGQR
jgi:hypothetical protein